MDDTELIGAVREGKIAAYGHLVNRYQGLIYPLCYRMTGNAVDAENLAHDAFVDAYLKLGQLRDPERFAPWLKSIALNLCRIWHRQRARETVGLPEHLPDVQEPESRTDHTRMLTGLAHLSTAHRLIVVLHYWEELSYEEIARFLAVPIGTVMSRLYRARRELRRWMERDEEEGEMESVPDESMRQEVEAEINLLIGQCGERPEARERISVLLRRSPERFRQLIAEASDESVIQSLAQLLRRLGPPAMEVILSLLRSEDHRLRERSVTLLRRSLFVGRPSRTGLPAARIALAEAYLLLDALFRADVDRSTTAALLLELIDARPDDLTILLLTHALLCDPETAFPLLIDRFWSMSSPQALYRPPDALYALCRFGTRFAAELIEPLRGGDAAHQSLALEGADALSRALSGSGLNLAATPDDRVALEARFRHKWAPPLSRERNPDVLSELAAALADLLTDPRTELRDKVLRILGSLKAEAFLERITACVGHSTSSTRIAALRALGEIAHPDSGELLCQIAREGDPIEQSIAVWGLGRLRTPEALPLLQTLAQNAAADVRRAAVSALGEMGDEARELLHELAGAHAVAAARSLRRIATTERRVPHERPAALRMEDRIREGAEPPFFISLEAALRALPTPEPIGETDLSRRIARLCRDFASTRRYLVDEGLMQRAAGTYELTPFGAVVWRVEHFLADQYMGGAPSGSSGGDHLTSV